MTKAKWMHKWISSDICNLNTYCEVFLKTGLGANRYWAKVTCPKCLAKKPARKKKQAETHLDFEMKGKVFITERKEDGTIVSQQQIDNYVVLTCLVSLLEESMKKQDIEESTEKYMNRYYK